MPSLLELFDTPPDKDVPQFAQNLELPSAADPQLPQNITFPLLDFLLMIGTRLNARGYIPIPRASLLFQPL
jgi:hypothetical protein